jgi:hypothetical protein
MPYINVYTFLEKVKARKYIENRLRKSREARGIGYSREVLKKGNFPFLVFRAKPYRRRRFFLKNDT